MEENTLKIEIVANDDGTHSLVVTGSAEDVATVASYLVLSIQAAEEQVDPGPEGDDLVG